MTQKQQEQELQQRYGEIVARAWADPAFKTRLLREPGTVLRENGIAVPPDVEVRIVEERDKVVHLPLPRQPSDEGLSEEQLANVAGGFNVFTAASLNFGRSAFYPVDPIRGSLL